ncbi:MAG: 3-isopropylmalate dehydratase small subunit [Acidobacteria bacterium]|nr:3-isopropylmalate dehydratase small subunit [Acidobacteriota bacterium]
MENSVASAGTARVVLKLGDDISTDAIYPGRYMATVLPGETPQYAFADYPEFNARLRNGQIAPGSVIAAGSNFGCGSSREQAASALKGYDLTIVAGGFGRIFLQNAVNLGLRILVCPALEAKEGDELEITADRIFNTTTGKSYSLQPLPAARRAIIEAGGLISYTRERLLKKHS